MSRRRATGFVTRSGVRERRRGPARPQREVVVAAPASVRSRAMADGPVEAGADRLTTATNDRR